MVVDLYEKFNTDMCITQKCLAYNLISRMIDCTTLPCVSQESRAMFLLDVKTASPSTSVCYFWEVFIFPEDGCDSSTSGMF